MNNIRRTYGKTALILVFTLFLAACNGSDASESAGPHDPPPPQGPPLTSDAAAAERELPITFLRIALQDEGDQIIDDFNQGSDHSLSWSSEAQPLECGYDCVGPPSISATRLLGQPNQYIATVRAHLDFNLDIDNIPFDRKIRTNVMFRVACSGWRDGSGEIQVLTQNDPPFIADDPGPVEDVLDFLLLPLNLSGQINARVEEQLGPGGAGNAGFSSPCRSLGVNSNFGTGASQFDSIFWESPAPGGSPVSTVPELSGLSEHIVVNFESIKRNSTPTLMDTSAGVFFDIYVNGRLIPAPPSGTFQIAPGTTVSLEDVAISIPSTDLDDLQIILADSLGGSGWVMFDREDEYGEGRHTLRTHRTELQPADLFPVPTDLPGSNKPVSVDLHEFELTYEIDYVPQPVLETTEQ